MPNLMPPSRTSVDKAGRILRRVNAQSEDFDFALDILSQWRSLHSYPVNAMKVLIRRHTAKAYPEAIVAQRLKRFASIVDKLGRYPSMSLAKMQAIGGLRVVLSTADDVYNLHNTLVCNSSHQARLPAADYIFKPKADGYRSVHQVFRYKSRSHPELDGMRVEVQIRSKLQHAWATAVETLGVITKMSLKTGQGSDEAKAYFRLASALFSLDENSPVLEEYKDAAPGLLVEELDALDASLQFSGKIRMLAKSIKAIDTSFRKSAYQLLELDTRRNRANIVGFSKQQLDYAEQLYLSREQDNRNNGHISVVLIGVGELNAIKAAYPNYFLDANLFLDNLERVSKIYRK
ncbi:MAG: RelA/SpoT domain-containing protein [Desulfovibrio sp.]|nr:RelA/SpoT domain-containing protein [Desulfovibrio sp.]